MLNFYKKGKSVDYMGVVFLMLQFIEKFKEVKDLTRNQVLHNQSPITVNGSDDSSQSTPRDSSSSGQPNRGFFHTRSSSLTSMRDTGVRTNLLDDLLPGTQIIKLFS